jgi:hypothetical protein
MTASIADDYYYVIQTPVSGTVGHYPVGAKLIYIAGNVDFLLKAIEHRTSNNDVAPLRILNHQI